MVIKKLNESINQIDNTDTLLDNMRTEVQKIIDNHLKDGIEPIFVKNRGFEKLNLFINLLT
ncbi:hypothetical protein IKI14_00845 [bacterium]|nr:hypothetical protein [bacterium]